MQANDVSGFVLKIGIVAGHVPLQTMRLQVNFFPDPMRSVLADTQFAGQFAATPVRGTVLRFSARGLENLCPQLRSDHRSQ